MFLMSGWYCGAYFTGLFYELVLRSLFEELNDSPNQALGARLDPVKLSLGE